MGFNILNIVVFVFWVLLIIAVGQSSLPFTTFEWLVLIILSVLGFTIVIDKPWFEENEPKDKPRRRTSTRRKR